VALGAFVLGFLATSLIWRLGGSPTTVVSVPDVRHRADGEARRLASRAGLELEVASSIAHPTAPAGTVLTQVPLPGHEVQPGTALRVTLSSGRAQLLMPELVGRRLGQALQVLEGLGIEAEVTEEPDLAPTGQVVAVHPAAGSPVAPNSGARLTVSAGPPLVEVPFLLGMQEQEAVSLLSEAGLVARVEEVADMFAAEASVVHQRPLPGESVRAGGSVTLQISRGFP
jgi:eukaryotic-like serine/threonine-protein kinase